MLKHVDLVNPVLIEYWKSINPDVQTGVLLLKTAEGPSKKSQKSKKDAKSTPEKPLQELKPKKPLKKQSMEEEHVSLTETMPTEPNVGETEKEVIPSKSGVFKRIKQKSHGSRKSPERSSSFSPTIVQKPHVTRQGVIILEVQAPVSPSSKKRRVKDMAKHISKKIKKRKLIFQKESSEDEKVPETPEATLPKTVLSP
ncbi:unnamed protein product [Lactuca saligna]|uniref:Uncharacterized protein n=1 Tax=Lactuca saligna TaxID=75948 RepID=A0AA35YEI7_LACSI|nr:unnamed protein product [Lactuca saligna]